MDAVRFKTKSISGIQGKVTVAINKETGSVYLEQRIMLSKDNTNLTDDLEHCKIIRESTRYIVFERAVHFHMKTFGNIIGALSELIDRNDMMNKFPDNIIKIKVHKQ